MDQLYDPPRIFYSTTKNSREGCMRTVFAFLCGILADMAREMEWNTGWSNAIRVWVGLVITFLIYRFFSKNYKK